MSKFKVGDKVHPPEGCTLHREITKVIAIVDGWITHESDSGGTCAEPAEEFTLVSKGGSIMSDVVSKLKELRLEPDTRLLKKHGIIDGEGDLTEEGESVVVNQLFNTVRDAIVVDLKKLDEQEKKK